MIIGRWTIAALAGIALLTVARTHVAAAEIASPAVLAGACANCHGPGGASPGAMPSIDQLGAAEMTGKLKSFRSGETPATVMNRIVRGYTDAEIEALGQYFASRLTKN